MIMDSFDLFQRMRHNLIVTVSNDSRHVPFYIIIIVRDMDIHNYCFDYIHPTVLIECTRIESKKENLSTSVL